MVILHPEPAPGYTAPLGATLLGRVVLVRRATAPGSRQLQRGAQSWVILKPGRPGPTARGEGTARHRGALRATGGRRPGGRRHLGPGRQAAPAFSGNAVNVYTGTARAQAFQPVGSCSPGWGVSEPLCKVRAPSGGETWRRGVYAGQQLLS